MPLTTDDVAEAIGIEVRLWPGNCFTIASSLLECKVVEGEMRYGIYWGPIAKRSQFSGRPFCRHAWISDLDDGIIDPTRWVFENPGEPTISRFFEYDAEVLEYDVGGSKLRGRYKRPPPEFDEPSKVVLDGDVREWLRLMLMFPGDRPSKDQLFWLANLSPDVLGNYARPIYEAYKKAKMGAFIPVDYQQVVLGGMY